MNKHTRFTNKNQSIDQSINNGWSTEECYCREELFYFSLSFLCVATARALRGGGFDEKKCESTERLLLLDYFALTRVDNYLGPFSHLEPIKIVFLATNIYSRHMYNGLYAFPIKLIILCIYTYFILCHKILITCRLLHEINIVFF